MNYTAFHVKTQTISKMKKINKVRILVGLANLPVLAVIIVTIANVLLP